MVTLRNYTFKSLINWLTLREPCTAEINFENFPVHVRRFPVRGPFSGPWDVCSLIRQVASSNNYKFTALSRMIKIVNVNKLYLNSLFVSIVKRVSQSGTMKYRCK